jgi:hypothetical protein
VGLQLGGGYYLGWVGPGRGLRPSGSQAVRLSVGWWEFLDRDGRTGTGSSGVYAIQYFV